jgi:CRP-like cAMP-binding protein
MHPAIFSTPTDSHHWSRQLGQALAERLRVDRQAVVQVGAGKILLPAGQAITRLPLLLSGRLDCVLPLQQGEAGSLIPISFEAGEIAMLSQLFCNAPVWVDVVAAQDCTLRWLPVAALEALLRSDAQLLLMLTQFLAHRLRDVQIRERSWVERSVHHRVLMQLVRLAQKTTPDAQGCRVIHATHEELAARCGVSRPKLTLELKRLEAQGLIRRGRGFIEILKPLTESSL